MKRAVASEAEVQALARLDLQGLRTVWRARYGAAPQLRAVHLLRLALAWRMQADVHGGLDGGTRRRLRDGASVGRADNISVGLRIVKDWRGQTYEASRVEGGYVWAGVLYPSLSALAQAITGVKRNGPKFFGLRDAEASS